MYDEFVEKHAKSLGAKIMRKDGNVFIYEIPTQAHAVRPTFLDWLIQLESFGKVC